MLQRPKDADRRIVEDLFRGMQAGSSGEEQVIGLFADDAVFVEPFSGTVQTHTGKQAIRKSFSEMTREPLPDMQLRLDRLDMDGDRIRAEWTCSSSAFPAPMRGHDLFTIRAGKIARLEICVTDMPPMAH